MRTSMGAADLSHACLSEAAAAVRREVLRWEEAHRGAALPGIPELATLRENFTSRMRAAAVPLKHELDAVVQELASAGAVMERCRVALGAGLQRDVGGAGIATARAVVLHAAAEGRARVAFEQALAWDAQHRDADISLVELACSRLWRQQDAGMTGEAPPPEEVLGRPEAEIGSMDGRVKVLLMFTLLERAVLDSTPLERIEANLEWVFGLLQFAGLEDLGPAHALEAARSKMDAALETLNNGEAPTALAQADQATKRRVAKLARLSLKGISLLVRAR